MENTDYKEEISASELAENNIAEYARYVVEGKFSSVYDGLKLIHRRILWTLGTNESMVKVSSLAGEIQNRFHPHGPAGIEDAITRLAQPFNNMVPLMYSKSNVGDYSGSTAAAGRYLPITSSEFARDVFFNRVNTSVFNYIPTEVGDGKVEPQYFIPIIPTALLTGTFGIGVGYRADCAPLNLLSVCELVKVYIELRHNCLDYRNQFGPIAAKYLIPDFPINQLIRNYDELLKAYQNGNYLHPIVVDGTMDLTPNTIALHTIPYGNSIKNVFLECGMETQMKDGFIPRNFIKVDDLFGGIKNSISEANTVFTTRRGVHPLALMDEFKKKVGFTQSWRPSPYYVGRNREILNCTPFDLLDIWYEERYRAILSELKDTQNHLVMKSRELAALVIIADHADEVCRIFNRAADPEETIAVLCKKFKLSQFQAKFLWDLPLKQLTKRGKGALIDDLNKVKAKLKELQNCFVNVDDHILEDVDFIIKKYANDVPRRTKIPNFIGWAEINGVGIIQVDSIEEYDRLINTWGIDKLQLGIYQVGNNFKYVVNSGIISTEDKLVLPKQFTGNYLVTAKHPLKYTVVVNGDTIFQIHGLYQDPSISGKQVLVGERFVAVDDDGTFHVVKTTSIVKRTSITALGNLSKIADAWYADLGTEDNSIVVAYMCDKEPNQIRLERLELPCKSSRLPIGNTTILGVVKTGSKMMVSLPTSITGTKLIRHLFIPNTAKVFESQPLIRVHLTRKQTDIPAVKVKPIKRNSDVYTLEV